MTPTPSSPRPTKAAKGTAITLTGYTPRRTLIARSLITDARILKRRGLTNQEIANRLGATTRTVSRWVNANE